ncbi:MAG: hypothetical protein Q4D65_10575 [Peptostreptococcaceae bacterium]|nr:hypothetical protein [Peptostreptococcaceae bacterium]
MVASNKNSLNENRESVDALSEKIKIAQSSSADENMSMEEDFSDKKCSIQNDEIESNKSKKKYRPEIMFLRSVIITLAITVVAYCVQRLSTLSSSDINNLYSLESIIEDIYLGFFFSILLVYPFVLTAFNLFFLVKGRHWERCQSAATTFDWITFILGIVLTFLLLSISDIRFSTDWSEVLINSQRHTPIFTKAQPTVYAIWILGLLGYLVLNHSSLKKLSPIAAVFSISALYLSIAQSFVFIVQIVNIKNEEFFLMLLPFNCIVISIRVIRSKILQWQATDISVDKYDGKSWINRANIILMKSSKWPLAAFVLTLPLLAIVMIFLLLLGQRPDYVIRAWTETSDWTLSQFEAPPNIVVDQHYLCTVAAGGHQKVVKPVRRGVRHGHEVIVNRQLCVANAFEQILEEKLPRFHKRVRFAYDTYGFPIAKLIRSKYIADVIYLLMKPLEWFFLLVIYSVDVNPENRIVIQYTGKKLQDFNLPS